MITLRYDSIAHDIWDIYSPIGYDIERNGTTWSFFIGNTVYIKNTTGSWSKGTINSIYEKSVNVGMQRQSYDFDFNEIFSLEEIRNNNINKIIE